MVKVLWTGLWISILLLHCATAIGQEDSIRKVFSIQMEPELRQFRAFHGEEFDIRSRKQVEEELLTKVYRAGYITTEITTDTIDSSVVRVILGEPYRWAELSADEAIEDVMRQAGVRVKRLNGKPMSPRKLSAMREGTIAYLENHGYPFASIQLDSVQFEDKGVRAKVVLEKGPLVIIDSVRVRGDLRLRKTYLTNYLGIHEGAPYSEKQIRQTSSALQQVPFLSEVKPADVLFSKDKTKLTLYLNDKNASRFDGIIGFLPDNNTGELLVTGDVKLNLQNALRQGESIDLNWRKLQTNTQELNAEAVAPFVLNSPFGVDGILKLYRRDTLFSDVVRQLGVRYKISRLNYLRLFVDRQTTNLISTDQYENTLTIPPYLDRAITSYGLSVKYGKVDFNLNPSKGLELFLEGAAGTKVIEENARLPEFIYDSLNLRTLQVKSRIDLAYYVRLVPRLVWHQRYLAAALINDQLFNNEAYRIGGLLTLRGFDEESIFATSYGIARSELRYQMDREGYVFTFFDAAYYENNSLNAIGAASDTPLGFGAGVTFGTRAGIFSLTYALGSQRGNPILLRAGKIHFGFVNVF